MRNQKVTYDMRRGFIWIMTGLMSVWMFLLILGTSGYAQGAENTLFVGEFENRTDIVNPLLSFISDTLNFLFSRSELADIRPIPAGLRSAYLQRARNEQPNVDATQLNLLAAEYGKADAVLLGSYSKTGAQWTMDTQLYVTRGGGRAKEDIRLTGDDVYRLLDSLAAEVSKRLGTGQYMLLSTPSWEAYESYRRGHETYYSFDVMGAMRHFQRAIELDPQLAIAHAELGMCRLLLEDPGEAGKAFAEAAKNLQNVSEQERFIVMGLMGYYEAGRLSGRAEMPRMRDDMVWDEPWLHWNIFQNSSDADVRNRILKQWLTSVLAYARAGFYSAPELVALLPGGGASAVQYSGISGFTYRTREFMEAFNTTGDPQFLEAALEFINLAADMEADDEYDDAWRHWELADIYSIMNRTSDAQEQRKNWLQMAKRKLQTSQPSMTMDDIARKYLKMGLLKEALELASKAVEQESEPRIRAVCLLTVADVYVASGELDEAFSSYVEVFEPSARGYAAKGALAASLSGLRKLMRGNPEFMDEVKRAKLDEIMETLENMDPLIARSEDTASESLYSGGAVFTHIKDFCTAMGDIKPALTLVRGMLKAETDPSERLVFLTYLSMFEGGITESDITESERRLLGVESGFIGTWIVIGPFENKDRKGFDTVYPPEKEIDLAKTYRSMGQEVRWQEITGNFIVDLTRIFEPNINVAAYAMTSITVPEEMDVQIKAGSDDTLTIWLNGERVHANNASREVTPDEDVVHVRLEKGENTILLKICQGDGAWGYCLRIVDKDGNPALSD
jgi:tetratricopeptide (TPR) repeat protein